MLIMDERPVHCVDHSYNKPYENEYMYDMDLDLRCFNVNLEESEEKFLNELAFIWDDPHKGRDAERLIIRDKDEGFENIEIDTLVENCLEMNGFVNRIEYIGEEEGGITCNLVNADFQTEVHHIRDEGIDEVNTTDPNVGMTTGDTTRDEIAILTVPFPIQSITSRTTVPPTGEKMFLAHIAILTVPFTIQSITSRTTVPPTGEKMFLAPQEVTPKEDVTETLKWTADKGTGECSDCERFNALSNETKIQVDILPNVYQCRTCKNIFTSPELLDHHRLIQVGEYRNRSAPENSRNLKRKRTSTSALDEDTHKESFNYHQLVQGTDYGKGKGVHVPVSKISRKLKTKKTTKSALEEDAHKEDVTEGECSDCGRYTGLSRTNSKIHDDFLPNVYRCRTCKNIFTSTEALDQHQLIQATDYGSRTRAHNSTQLETKKTFRKNVHFKLIACRECGENKADIDEKIIFIDGESYIYRCRTCACKGISARSYEDEHEEEQDQLCQKGEGHTHGTAEVPMKTDPDVAMTTGNTTQDEITVLSVLFGITRPSTGEQKCKPPKEDSHKEDVTETCRSNMAPSKSAECSDCVRFTALSNETHSKLYVDVLPNIYRCRTCNNIFTSTEWLEHHQLVQAGDDSNRTGVSNKKMRRCNKSFRKCLDCGHITAEANTKVIFVDEISYIYRCRTCKTMFVTTREYKEQDLIFAGDRPTTDRSRVIEFKISNIRYYSGAPWIKVRGSAKPYVCEICFGRFAKWKDAVEHKLTHVGRMTCISCGDDRNVGVTEDQTLHRYVKHHLSGECPIKQWLRKQTSCNT